jgi:hypothetical protein
MPLSNVGCFSTEYTALYCRIQNSSRIRRAPEQVATDMLQRVCQEVEYQLGICRGTNGKHVESN